jgi:hypothetical protein
MNKGSLNSHKDIARLPCQSPSIRLSMLSAQPNPRLHLLSIILTKRERSLQAKHQTPCDKELIHAYAAAVLDKREFVKSSTP